MWYLRELFLSAPEGQRKEAAVMALLSKRQGAGVWRAGS